MVPGVCYHHVAIAGDRESLGSIERVSGSADVGHKRPLTIKHLWTDTGVSKLFHIQFTGQKVTFEQTYMFTHKREPCAYAVGGAILVISTSYKLLP